MDIYHVLEHVAEAAQGLFGKSAEDATAWNDRARDALLAGGWPSMRQLLRETKTTVSRTRWRKHGRPL